ncbi:MAG: hypothetical protein QOH96_1651 [Blastocatellia bacterium]|nr:hypothetical protein [Blastocatellia bacterium]
MRQHGIVTAEVRPAAQAAFITEIDDSMRGTVWTAGGCKSWYLDETGRNSTLWPRSSWRFRRRVARFEPSDYLFREITTEDGNLCSNETREQIDLKGN